MIIRDSVFVTFILMLKCSMSASIKNKNSEECISNLKLSHPNINDLCQSENFLDVTNVSDEKFLFDFQDYLCYTVRHNIKALCDNQEKSFNFQPIEQDHGKFCSSLPKIDIEDKCVPWLKDPQSQDSSSDCQLLSRVVKAVTENEKNCSQNCIKSDKVDPVCISLVETSLLLVKAAKETSPNDAQPAILTPENDDDKKTASKDIPTPQIGSPTLSDSQKPSEEKNNLTKSSDPAASLSTKSEKASSLLTPSKNAAVEPTKTPKTVLEDPDVNSNENTAGESNKNIDDKSAEKKKEEESETKDIMIEEESKSAEKMNKEESKSAQKIKDEEIKSTEEEGNINEEIDDAEDEVLEDQNDLPPIVEDEKQEIANKKDSQKDSQSVTFEGPGIGHGPDIESESHFFTYFMLLSLVAIVAYLVFHNKQKILALILEGRRSQGNRRRSGGREYRKLDSNLEDTMDTGRDANLRQVIY